MGNQKIKVEVAYALPDKQYIIELELAVGSTIEAAILCSGMLGAFPDMDLSKQKVGIFGRQRRLLDTVVEGDRIEIYRPLIVDPKEARRTKAKFKK
ncbi:MAG: RnfH family protein [Gammaproteobacteria bacterium]|nr:RnfH family protein [Gammaproteobacteria bacterium]MCW5583575.1 RnfH family protein [Gammaproteobacteria bacterium]